MNRKFGAFSSSENPEKLALTVKGILIAIVPVVIMIGQGQGWAITEGDLMGFIETAGKIIAASVTMYGLFRKLKNANISV